MKKINVLIGLLLLILSMSIFNYSPTHAVRMADPNVGLGLPLQVAHPLKLVQEPQRPISAIPAIGILTQGKDVLPLYGRRLSRDRWVYHSMTDKYHSIMIPLKVKGRDSLDEYGVDELYTDDMVHIDGHPHPYRVRLYLRN